MGEGGRRDSRGKEGLQLETWLGMGWHRVQETGQGCSAQEGVSSEGIWSENNPEQGKGETEAQKGTNFATWGRKYSLKHSINQELLHYMAASKYFQSDTWKIITECINENITVSTHVKVHHKCTSSKFFSSVPSQTTWGLLDTHISEYGRGVICFTSNFK